VTDRQTDRQTESKTDGVSHTKKKTKKRQRDLDRPRNLQTYKLALMVQNDGQTVKPTERRID